MDDAIEEDGIVVGSVVRGLDDAMNSDECSTVGDDLEAGPVARNRSNTWHGPPKVTPRDDADLGPDGEGGADRMGAFGGPGACRKGAARRNAWGNLSYADLITKAIESTPDQRMTLSQIYGWMVQNISFFKDKGETNSSAGWKNSIRHNLSLHNRFMRVQNEGTGKSSWWMINPDAARAAKIPRRRAATMDAKTYAAKRGSRSQRSAGTNFAQSSSAELPGKIDGPDDHEMGTEHQRSSGSGGISLSHMQPVTEMDDASDTEFVLSSSSPWASSFSSGENFAETLSESLADIFVGNLTKGDDVRAPGSRGGIIGVPLSAALNANSSTRATFVARNRPIMHPVISPRIASTGTRDNSTDNALQMFGPASFAASFNPGVMSNSPDPAYHFTKSAGPAQPAVDSVLQESSCNIYANKSNELLQAEVMMDKVRKPRSPSENPLCSNQFGPAFGISRFPSTNVAAVSNPRPLNSQLLLQLLANKPQLMAKMQHLIQTRQQQQLGNAIVATHPVQSHPVQSHPVQSHPVQSHPVVSIRSNSSMLQQLLISSSDAVRRGPFHPHRPPSPTIDVPTLVTSNTSTFIPADLDLNFLDFDAADIDCDIDQVIKHELTFGENLDFAFDRSTDV